jgi:hypothetical protein
MYRDRENTLGLFTVRSCGGFRSMETDTLQKQLTACIRDALRRLAYHPPQTRDTSITDPFFERSAAGIVEGLKGAGWRVQPAATVWRDIGQGGNLGVSKRTPADAEGDLRSCIRIALALFRYKPPRGRDPLAFERYHQSIAESVVAKVMMSNWELVRTLQEIAPAPRHSTPRH